MVDQRAHPRWSRTVTVLSWVLAASFLIGGIAKYVPGETFFGAPYSEKFVDWGYPSWLRFVVGSGELIGGLLLLLVPRLRLLASGLLLVILQGAVVTHVINSDPLAYSVAAPVTLVLTAVVAWASAPWDWRSLWRQQPG